MAATADSGSTAEVAGRIAAAAEGIVAAVAGTVALGCTAAAAEDIVAVAAGTVALGRTGPVAEDIAADWNSNGDPGSNYRNDHRRVGRRAAAAEPEARWCNLDRSRRFGRRHNQDCRHSQDRRRNRKDRDIRHIHSRSR